MKNLTIRTRLLMVITAATLFLTIALVSLGAVQEKREVMSSMARQVEVAIWAFSRSLPIEAQGFTAGQAAEGRINGLIADDAKIAIPEQLNDSIFKGLGVHVTYFHYDAATSGFVRVMTSIVGPDGKRAVSTPLDPKGPVLPVLLAGDIYTGQAQILGETYLTRYEPVFDANGKITGAVFAGKSIALIQASIWQSALVLAGFGFVLALAAAAASLFLLKRAISPLRDLAQSVNAMKSGSYDEAIPHVAMADEVGVIAQSLEDMRQSLTYSHQLENEQKQRLAEQALVVEKLTEGLEKLAVGDLSHSLSEPFGESYEVLRAYFNEAVQKMHDSVAQIAELSEKIRAQSGEMSKSSDELAHRTEVQAATLEQTAAAMDEMTASFKSAASSLREVEGIVLAAREDADKSGTVVVEAVRAMESIEKSSSQITQIIGVIDDIAFQTNLLALNAGVEAARAGEAGRGFAVVASEVGALAQRASTAAKEIKDLISTSSQHVDAGAERVKQAGSALHNITRRVGDISTLTTNIATGAQEQAIGLNEINLGVTQLDQSTQQNAALAEEANAASQLMATSADELASLVGRFQLAGRKANAQISLDTTANFDQEPVAMVVNGGPVPVMMADSAAPPAVLGATNPQPSLDPTAPAAAKAKGIWQDF